MLGTRVEHMERRDGDPALSLVLSHHRTVDVFDPMPPAETTLLLLSCVVATCEPTGKAYGRTAESVAREGLASFAQLLEHGGLEAFLQDTYGMPGEPGERMTLSTIEAWTENGPLRVDVTSAHRSAQPRHSVIVTSLIEAVAGIAAHMDRPPAEFLRNASTLIVDGGTISLSGDAALQARMGMMGKVRGQG